MPTCHQTLLAHGTTAQLTRCSCGHLHLALGPLTVRLDEGALRDVFATVHQGLAALAGGGAEAVEVRGGFRQ